MLRTITETATGPGMRRVLGRMGRCVLSYVLLHVAVWIVIALVVPEWSFLDSMRVGLLMLAFTGIPTVLLAIVAGLAHQHVEVARFRALLAFPMVFFALPLIGAAMAEALVLQVMAQVAFAVWLMPTPLVPENWKGQP
ncbi:hypothetical protein OH809_03190 [Streptomyces sp. NBC_00873]|uniref:hypothetical protein n=1 Tax=unclassified Streptomyces TaxID=2593676 RepID=UPI003866DEEB|nr:hypothetical protein OH809_03190 [Streptomyces sp. NBC_00873]WTA48112.1 hypothetical protein OH821_40615 [Streptomyces sp. NBC_00842]